MPRPKRGFTAQGVMRAWILSYLLILATQLLVSGAIAYQTTKTFEVLVTRTNRIALDQTKLKIDETMARLVRIANDMEVDPLLMELERGASPPRPAERLVIQKYSQGLGRHVLANGFLKDALLVIPERDLVIGSGTSVSLEEFIQVYGPSYALDPGLFRGLGRVEQTSPLVDLGSPGLTHALAFVRRLPFGEASDRGALAVLLLDESGWFAGKDILEAQAENLFIINSDDRILASMRPLGPDAGVRFLDLPGESGKVRVRLQGRAYVHTYIPSTTQAWKYVLSIPEDLYWRQAVSIRNLLVASLLVSLIMGALISVYALRKNYGPLRRIVERIGERLPRPEGKGYTEYLYLERLLEKVDSDDLRINQLEWQRSQALRRGFLRSLLKGNSRGAPVQELAQGYGLSLPGEHFAVLLLMAESQDSLPDIEAILLSALKPCPEGCSAEVTEMDDLIVAILNLADPDPSRWQPWIGRAVEEAGRALNAEHKVEWTAVVSGLVTGLDGVGVAWTSALRDLESRQLLGTRDLFPPESPPESSRPHYPIEKEYHLINAMKAGDFATVQTLFRELVNANIDPQSSSSDRARYLLLNLTSTVLKATDELGPMLQDDFLARLNPLGVFEGRRSLAAMADDILGILGRICERILQFRKDNDYRIRDRIIAIIHESYQDINFSLGMLAERMDMSMSYLSRSFKEQTGSGLLEYLTEYRVQKARELMDGGFTNIETLARQVGYANARTFVRAFKRFEGITPGKMKK